VITTTESLTGAGWAGAQDQLAGLSTHRIHRTVDSTHEGLLQDVRPAAASVRGIKEVISSVRTGTPLPTPLPTR